MRLVFITKEEISCISGRTVPRDVYGYYESEKEITNIDVPIPMYFPEFGKVLLQKDQFDKLELI